MTDKKIKQINHFITENFELENDDLLKMGKCINYLNKEETEMKNNIVSFVGFGESLGSSFQEAQELAGYHPPRSEFFKIGTVLALDEKGYYIRLIELSTEWSQPQRLIFALLKFRSVEGEENKLVSDPVNHHVAHGYFLKKCEFERSFHEVNGDKEVHMKEIMHWEKFNEDGTSEEKITSWIWIGYNKQPG